MIAAQLASWSLFFLRINPRLQGQYWILAAISLFIAAFGLGITISKHWGRVPRSRLRLDIADSRGPDQNEYDGLYSHGWIENPRVPVTQDEVLPAIQDGIKEEPAMEQRSRVRAHFARAKVTNLGRFTANSITLSLTSINRRTDRKASLGTDREAIVTTVQPLRWSDTWFFQADQSRNIVNASPGILTFPTMPLGDHRYCDVCFHYDLRGPASLGRFVRGRVYFAVGNLPSSTYSLGDGEYDVTFNLVAENCDPVQLVCRLFINLGIDEPRDRIRFQTISQLTGLNRPERLRSAKAATASL